MRSGTFLKHIHAQRLLLHSRWNEKLPVFLFVVIVVVVTGGVGVSAAVVVVFQSTKSTLTQASKQNLSNFDRDLFLFFCIHTFK